MKNLPKGWPEADHAKTIGFFAQAALELVHEESWESYKLPALSPLRRLVETGKIATDVMRGPLTQKVLDPVVQEANQSLCADPVCNEILTCRGISPADIAISEEDKAQDIFSQSGFLLKLCQKSYRKTAENLLVDECFGTGRRSKIYLLLKNYLSDLVLEGHSRIYIEEKVRAAFFESAPTKVSRRTLRTFFRQFPEKRGKFRVYGAANKKLVVALSHLIPVKELKGRSIPGKLKAALVKERSEAFFAIETESFDQFAAVHLAGKLLSIGEAVLLLFPGKELGKVPQQLMVSKVRSSEIIEAEIQPPFLRRVLSHSKNSANQHMDRVRKLIVAENRGRETLLGSSFLHATMMAGIGDKSTAPEVKLLTLWAAFETLLPDVPEGSTNRISHFLEYIVPAVTLSYAHDCFVEFSRDAERLHHNPYVKYLDDTVAGKASYADKLATIVISGDASQQYRLCSVFKSNPLALYRLSDLQKKFSTPESFQNTLTDHAKRVSWQIQRIYRERNTVMHNGESSPAMARLLSNTYYYYMLTFANIETVAKSYGDLSIPQTMSAMRKLNQADRAKVVKAKGLFKLNLVEG
jgi:hypothetical protein